MTTAGSVVGWDVGGANLKAVRLDGGAPPAWLEEPFEVWRDPRGLASAVAAVARRLGTAGRHAVTMTAELADCFATKRAGVAAVLDAVSKGLQSSGSSAELRVLDVAGALLPASAARARPLSVASANWAASARWVAGEPDLVGHGAVLLDVGSTTADLIPLAPGRVLARAHHDPERLLEGELVYVGVQRTPVCAVVSSVPFRGRECPVAAEHFAIAADAHVWLGAMPERAYRCATPDGGPPTHGGARARLARVVCADGEMLSDDDVTAIAARIAGALVDRLADALRRVGTRVPAPPRVLLAGSGTWLGRAAAQRAGLPFVELRQGIGDVADVLPAYAVAVLAWREEARGDTPAPHAGSGRSRETSAAPAR